MLDEGYQGFQPSNLEVTTIDVGNSAANVIPARARARLNIRFNPAHAGAALCDWLRSEARPSARASPGRVTVDAAHQRRGLPHPARSLHRVVVSRVAVRDGDRRPELSTTGGTSDARFIRALCPVVEFGLVGATMHAVDERAPVADIPALTAIYRRLIDDYFAAFAG